MSRIVRVFDPSRDPPEWQQLLRGAEVAVFTEDAHADIPTKDAAGMPTCEIFDDIRLAEVHCNAMIAANPRLRCMVFDSTGRGGDPIATFQSPKLRTGELSSRFRRWFSALMITSAVVLIWLDWRSDFERMWPSILAWKFVTTALVFITWESVLVVQRMLARRRS